MSEPYPTEEETDAFEKKRNVNLLFLNLAVLGLCCCMAFCGGYSGCGEASYCGGAPPAADPGPRGTCASVVELPGLESTGSEVVAYTGLVACGIFSIKDRTRVLLSHQGSPGPDCLPGGQPPCFCRRMNQLLERKVRTNLDSILRSRDMTLPTRVCLVKAMVFSVVTYGCESWTIKKA